MGGYRLDYEVIWYATSMLGDARSIQLKRPRRKPAFSQPAGSQWGLRNLGQQRTSRNLPRGCFASATHQIDKRDGIRRFIVTAPCHVLVRTHQHELMRVE